MGKNTDKLYVTQSEHSGTEGRHASSTGISHKKYTAIHRRLPFYYCSLSLQRWEHPVCVVGENKTATIFDLLTIVPWLQTKGTNPTTGGPLEAKDLIKLNFSTNDEDEYCDPITRKVFNDHTHIIALANTGNVFAYETLHTLNLQAKNWKDLVTDELFTRSDIITIQDPHDLGTDKLSEHKHLEEAQQAKLDTVHVADTSKDQVKRLQDARTAIDRLRKNSPTGQTVKQLQYSTPSNEHKKPLPYNAANYTTGYTAASFTSTGMPVRTADDRALLSEEQYLLHPKKIKSKALGIIKTTYGNLEIELWPEHAPKAVYNFVKLSKSGYYNGVEFHRNISGFMIQGGDPTGRGSGGKSIFGKDFEDEISAHHSHDKRGLISMANKGPGTNSSQFFITYGAAKHLDKKHTNFGQIIGGADVLDRLERLPVDGDKPRTSIKMFEVQILLDPFDEFLEKEKLRRDRNSKQLEVTDDDRHTWTNEPARGVQYHQTSPIESQSVGKYITKQDEASQQSQSIRKRPAEKPAVPTAKKIKKTGFGNFSDW